MEQEEVRRLRDKIRDELGRVKFELFESPLTRDLVDDAVARTRHIRTAWTIVRKLCKNPFHDNPKKGGICPDCGIESFEGIFNLKL